MKITPVIEREFTPPKKESFERCKNKCDKKLTASPW